MSQGGSDLVRPGGGLTPAGRLLLELAKAHRARRFDRAAVIWASGMPEFAAEMALGRLERHGYLEPEAQTEPKLRKHELTRLGLDAVKELERSSGSGSAD